MKPESNPMYSYDEAFSRNLGWVTPDEQEFLRHRRVAIAGLGGVGGLHLVTLARLGVGSFNLAEFDRFELGNFNRQAGATVSNVGRPKLDVMVEMASGINPELDIRAFPEGVSRDNVGDFLSGVDAFADGLDFFAFEARRITFAACATLGIPAVTAAPLGMGAALLNFLPGGMTFEEYFRLEGQPESEQALRFLLGLSPKMLQRNYLADRSRVNLREHRGPSTVMACQLCAGVVATETLKILLKRGRVVAAPASVHVDAYRNKLTKSWRPWGNANPLQQLALAIARRQLGTLGQTFTRPAHSATSRRPIEAILDLARWAPSGDNTQPWRFEILSDDHVVVHGFDTRDDCVYDLDGRASQIAIGALLETMRLAATAYGLRTETLRRTDVLETRPTFDVRFFRDATIHASDLVPFIEVRSVQRRPLSTRPLTPAEKSALETSLGSAYEIVWLERWRERWATALITSANAKIRLTIPEAFEVHRRVIEWGAQFSEARIPDRAVGLDAISRQLMRWLFRDWRRVDFFNRFLGGTLAPRVQLEVIPGLACAAHFVVLARQPSPHIDSVIDVGAAVQRFWLTATRLGLQQQPEMTPLIFARYAREGRRFTAVHQALEEARGLASRLEALLGDDRARRGVWMGRIGAGSPARARSLRLPTHRLMCRG